MKPEMITPMAAEPAMLSNRKKPNQHKPMKTQPKIAAMIATLTLAASTPLWAANHAVKHAPETGTHAQHTTTTHVERTKAKKLSHPARTIIRYRTVNANPTHTTHRSTERTLSGHAARRNFR